MRTELTTESRFPTFLDVHSIAHNTIKIKCQADRGCIPTLGRMCQKSGRHPTGAGECRPYKRRCGSCRDALLRVRAVIAPGLEYSPYSGQLHLKWRADPACP